MSKTIQGLNLESQFTTVKIHLDGKNIVDVTKILDKIASFHPIFIKEYIVSETELVIRSKLPHIWRESEETFNALSKGDIGYEKAEEFVIETVIGKRIKSMSTIPILDTAQSLNIETTPILDDILLKELSDGYKSTFNRYYVIGSGRGNQITGSISSSKDAYIAENIQKDKWSSNIVIQRLNLPIPKWAMISNESELESLWSEFEKPVVIKPTGLTGGNGVVVGINTLEQAKKAFLFAIESVNSKERSTWQKKIMIQEQVSGEDYRLLVIDGKLEIVTKRIPAFTIADGKRTINQLIEDINKDPKRDTTNPTHILKPIIIDEPLKSLLDEQGYTLESKPKEGTRIELRKVASMSQGGITQDCTENVSKEIKYIVETIAQSIHAFTLGVDIICKDISKPLTQDNGGILEINTMPESYLNFYPVLGTQRGYVAKTYINALLRENKSRIFVVIGQPNNDLPTILREKNMFGSSTILKNENVGEIKEDAYILNGLLVNHVEEHWKAVDALKLNSSLDVLILHLRDWNDVEEYGLGFDHINMLYVTKDMNDNKEYMGIM